MKLKIDKKYLYWGLTAFFVCILCICFIYLIYNGNTLFSNIKKIIVICMPIVDGFIVAYLLAPIVNFLEQKCFIPLCNKLSVKQNKKIQARMRGVSIILSLIFVFFLIYGFIMVVMPQLYKSIESIVIHFPAYINNLVNYINKLLSDNPTIEATVTQYLENYSKDLENWLNQTLLPGMNEIIKTLSQSVISFFVALWNLIIGLIISVYVLFSKERFSGQCKKTIYSLFEREHANQLIKDIRFADKTFGGFISGKLLDSLIIGLLCFICLNIIGTPYPILISVIVGVTNVIPFFGPYFGAIPSAILILLVNPIQCVYFLVFIFILQQFDGNFLGPKILGNSTGLTSFWVIFSITLFGGLFGVLGMLLGVPTFAVIYAFARRKIVKKLKHRGLPVATDDYIDLDYINDENVAVAVVPAMKQKDSAEKKKSFDNSNHKK